MSTTITADTIDLAATGIIDCDTHLSEPPDLWTSRTAKTLHGRMPTQRTVNGETHWYLDDEKWSDTGGNIVKRGREKVRGGYIMHPFDDVDPAAWSITERLKLMDSLGTWAQVAYPNAVGFSSNTIFAIDDVPQRDVVLRSYNDFLTDSQLESDGRIFPQALLPIWDMKFTIAEMERLLDKGIRGFVLSDKPEQLGLPELWEPYFEPMWDLFDSSRAVASFHVGGARTRAEQVTMRASRDRAPATAGEKPSVGVATGGAVWNGFGPQRTLAAFATQIYMSNVRIIVNLCLSDMFDRYPNLKIVSAESGIGWVPFILEALEYQVDEMIADPHEQALQSRRPTEYFRDHIFVMFWFERSAPAKLIEDVGVGNVLVETDFPHPTCLYPDARQHFDEVLAHLPAPDRQRILRDNAIELYRIPAYSAAAASG